PPWSAGARCRDDPVNRAGRPWTLSAAEEWSFLSSFALAGAVTEPAPLLLVMSGHVCFEHFALIEAGAYGRRNEVDLAQGRPERFVVVDGVPVSEKLVERVGATHRHFNVQHHAAWAQQ